ncbi:MAG: CDP-glycerol glycerophosphotransferase family protein [Clostridiales bacterium]|jgi:glycosyltransferase involved in cell wall biosynthesis|nr:CDP-glycerol glycerophosphotransferase family protein [Clostridiales bacterium]
MYKVSVIIPFYNAGEYLIDTIDSVIEQEFSFKDIGVILIDDGSNDGSSFYARLYARKYPNVKLISQTNKGLSTAKNKGIELALREGSEFTFFLDADGGYNKNYIKKCIEAMEKYPESAFVFGKPRFLGAGDKQPEIYNLPAYKATREISILDADAIYVNHVAKFPRVLLQGGWRTAILENYRFNETLTISEDIDFIFRVLIENKFVFCKEIEYLYRIEYTGNSAMNAGKNEWYICLWETFMPLYRNALELYGFVPRFIQQAVVENIKALFSADVNEKLALEIDRGKLDEAMSFIAENTDESVIMQNVPDHWQRMYFLKSKYGEPNITRWAPIPTFVMNKSGETDSGLRLVYLGADPLLLHIVREKGGILLIRASMRCITYKHFELSVKADFQTDVNELPPPVEHERLYFGGREIFPRKYYEIKIDPGKPNKVGGSSREGLIRFLLLTDYGISVNVRIEIKENSGLGYNMPFTLGDNYIVKRTKQNSILKVSPFTERELLDYCPEIEPYAELGIPQKASAAKFNFLKENILNTFRSFANRRIWLFMDRSSETGNNAEALFRYCAGIDDGIQKYYIIPDESYAGRFAGLPYMILGTLEYKLLCCFAEKFISSFPFDEGVTLQFGIDTEQKELYEDIRNFKKLAFSFFRGDIIHIWHGVISQNISLLNKFEEDTQLIFSGSKPEYDYISGELRYAIDERALRLTGLPRNDYLEKVKNNPNSQKIVLFAPSFDRNYSRKDEYSPEYKYSGHYRCINSILNSQELLGALEKDGYTMYFKPHYILRPQMRDFDLDPRVEVVDGDADRYELYAMSDLMITDYSGIAFDFAYLKKPVVYAHFLEKPNFEGTYFSYKDDGFGEVCRDIDILTETVSGYLETGCEMKIDHQRRVDRYFTFQDAHNCERAYEEILKLPDTRKNIFE